jgi:hypothetical protein
VGLGWAAWYSSSGFGASGSALYVDPSSGLPFLAALLGRAPVLLWGLWAWPGADISMVLSRSGQTVLWGSAVALTVGLTFLLLPLLRRHAQARFLALGMVGSLVPAAATFPSNRLLVFASIGGMGLVAMLTGNLAGAARRLADGPRMRRGLVAGTLALLVLVHGVLSPLMIHPTAASMAQLETTVQQVAQSLPTDAAVAEQDLVIVYTSSSFVSQLAAIVQAEGSSPLPRSNLQLAAGLHGATVTRPDEFTLVVAPRGGYLRASGVAVEGVPSPVVDLDRAMAVLEGLFRDVATRPFSRGDRIPSAGVVAEVLEVREGRPQAVAFHFEEPLESSRWRFVFRSRGPYRPFEVPPVGGVAELE